MKPALLIQAKRNNIIERQHFGFVQVVDKNENVVLNIGDDKGKSFYFRSAEKPLQGSLIIKSGAFAKFNLTLQELAVCCASHIGTEEHINTVQSILNKIGFSEKNLQCGIHEPIDKETRDLLVCKSLSPSPLISPLYNNCSGKHAGMLAVCIANRWDIDNYLDFDHPLQKEITKTISEFCNFPENQIITTRDGCSAPVHALPYSKMGLGFLNLFLNQDYENLRNAFQKYPFFVGGKGRLDSHIIKASSGKLISKVAAEGLCITVNLEQEQALIVKILDADMKARSIATIEALKQLKWLSEEELDTAEIKSLYDLDVKTLKNQTVGRIEPYDYKY